MGVVVEVFFFDFLAELFFDFFIDAGIMYLLSGDEGGFGVLFFLQFSELPFFDVFDEFWQIDEGIEVPKVLHEEGHFLMGIVFIQFFFDELLFAVPFAKGGSLLWLDILFLFDGVAYVLE